MGRIFSIDFPWLWSKEEDYREEEVALAVTSHFQLDDWHPFETKGIRGGVTFSGEGTSLGTLVAEAVQIRAFGPQRLPLSDSKGFGIRSTSTRRWASSAALPHIWFDVQVKQGEESVALDLTFFGLSLSDPLAFCFYVKAGSAKIGKEVIAPGTLHRYRGKAQIVLLAETLQLEGSNMEKMEIIPLAGRGGFWNCEYLIAFEIHHLNPKVSFLFKTLNYKI